MVPVMLTLQKIRDRDLKKAGRLDTETNLWFPNGIFCTAAYCKETCATKQSTFSASHRTFWRDV